MERRLTAFAALTQELQRRGLDQTQATMPALTGNRDADWSAFSRVYQQISAKLPGVSRAPPIPWRARAATSVSMFGAKPQAVEATANHTTPIRNTRLRPKWSPISPACFPTT